MKFPQARKELLDDRNKRWVPKLQAMLKENASSLSPWAPAISPGR